MSPITGADQQSAYPYQQYNPNYATKSLVPNVTIEKDSKFYKRANEKKVTVGSEFTKRANGKYSPNAFIGWDINDTNWWLPITFTGVSSCVDKLENTRTAQEKLDKDRGIGEVHLQNVTAGFKTDIGKDNLLMIDGGLFNPYLRADSRVNNVTNWHGNARDAKLYSHSTNINFAEGNPLWGAGIGLGKYNSNESWLFSLRVQKADNTVIDYRAKKKYEEISNNTGLLDGTIDGTAAGQAISSTLSDIDSGLDAVGSGNLWSDLVPVASFGFSKNDFTGAFTIENYSVGSDISLKSTKGTATVGYYKNLNGFNVKPFGEYSYGKTIYNMGDTAGEISVDTWHTSLGGEVTKELSNGFNIGFYGDYTHYDYKVKTRLQGDLADYLAINNPDAKTKLEKTDNPTSNSLTAEVFGTYKLDNNKKVNLNTGIKLENGKPVFSAISAVEFNF